MKDSGKCLLCGELITSSSGKKRFCSKKCNSKYYTLSKSTCPKIKTCLHCSKEFKPYNSLDKFCGYDCRIGNMKSKRAYRWPEDKVKARVGVNNPAYRNGFYAAKTRTNKVGTRKEFVRNSKFLKETSIENQGYISCQHCNINDSLRWEVHHIIYRSEKPEHEHLHKLDNLILLCIKCHNEFHKHKAMRNSLVIERKLNLLFGNDVLDK